MLMEYRRRKSSHKLKIVIFPIFLVQLCCAIHSHHNNEKPHRTHTKPPRNHKIFVDKLSKIQTGCSNVLLEALKMSWVCIKQQLEFAILKSHINETGDEGCKEKGILDHKELLWSSRTGNVGSHFGLNIDPRYGCRML